MNKRLNDIKSLLKSGDYDKATEALKAYREEFPDDWDGKLMEGLVAQLCGDEATFRRIHDEAQAIIDKHDEQAVHIQASPLWKKYHASWKKIAKAAVIGILAAGAVGGAFILLNNAISARLLWIADVIMTSGRTVYDCPPDIRPKRLHEPDLNQPPDQPTE